MKVLELFAGSRSVGKMAEQMGCEVFSTDLYKFEGINLAEDITLIMKYDIPFVPNFIWASPPCTTFSIAAVSHHRRGIEPISKDAKAADKILKKTIDIIKWFPEAKFFIENPVGMMRKMPIMRQFERKTVNYCKYSDTRMKPTDIWSNHIYSMFNEEGWKARTRCYNNNKKCHHEAAPRGSRTGTQGLKGDYDRSKIPSELCKEILSSVVAVGCCAKT